jgi:hypothetical protein
LDHMIFKCKMIHEIYFIIVNYSKIKVLQ